MELFFNQNWVFNFIHFGPLTFHLSLWSFTTNLGNLIGFFFHVYLLLFWIYFSLSFLNFLWGQKWVTTYSFFLQCLRSKISSRFCIVSLWRKKCLSDLLSDPPILEFQKLFLFLKKENGLITWVAYPFLKLKKLVYFHGQHAPFEIQRWISASLCASLKLVYFYRRPLTRPKDWCLLLSVGVSK
jgi:hypothetical protein